MRTFNRENLERILRDPAYTPARLIGFIGIKYGESYEANAGIREGYTIAAHTRMVLEQYDRYEHHASLPAPMSTLLFRTLIALHDIGKKRAIQDGDKRAQHVHTRTMMEETLGELEFSEAEVALATSIVCNNFIGNTIRRTRQGDRNGIDDNARNIATTAAYIPVAATDFLLLSTLLYKVDTASYTEDAGGPYDYSTDPEHPSLAFLFDFASSTPENGLVFAPNIYAAMQKLGERVVYFSS